jgi:hypothetical protein
VLSRAVAGVAHELKGLSDQIAKAINEIGREISEVQLTSTKVAETIRASVEGVAQVNQYVSGVATAIEADHGDRRDFSAFRSDGIGYRRDTRPDPYGKQESSSKAA